MGLTVKATGEREKERNRRSGDQEGFWVDKRLRDQEIASVRAGNRVGEWRRAGLRPAYGDHEIRKNKQHLTGSCLFFRIS